MNSLATLRKRAYSFEGFKNHAKDVGIGALTGLGNSLIPGLSLYLVTNGDSLSRQEESKEEPSALSKYKGTFGGGVGSALVGGATTAYLSKENKLRNAILIGLLSGILGGGAGYAYDSGILNKWLGRDK